MEQVAADTAPVVVVIWSKYASDAAADPDLPPEDQPTEAELFEKTIIDAEPKFKGRLLFVRMPKPKVQDRPEPSDWIKTLQSDIKNTLEVFPACDLLWSWESIVPDAEISLSEELTTLALKPGSSTDNPAGPNTLLEENLKLVFRVLAKEQGGPDCSRVTSPRHLAAALAQSLADHLEHAEGIDALSHHGAWLCDFSDVPDRTPFAAPLNGLLLTAAASGKAHPFFPGTIYRLDDMKRFEKLFGIPLDAMAQQCYNGSPAKFDEWKSDGLYKPVLVELSPSCDVQQGLRRNAMLIGGFILRASARKLVKRADAIEIVPPFSLRWPADDFCRQDAFLAFFSRCKVTISPKKEPKWLIPWFRLRELPTASLRNWHASHASRVGYVSLS